MSFIWRIFRVGEWAIPLSNLLNNMSRASFWIKHGWLISQLLVILIKSKAHIYVTLFPSKFKIQQFIFDLDFIYYLLFIYIYSYSYSYLFMIRKYFPYILTVSCMYGESCICTVPFTDIRSMVGFVLQTWLYLSDTVIDMPQS